MRDSHHDSLNIGAELAALWRLLDTDRPLPELKVRRCNRRPNRWGFADWRRWRISLSVWPGITKSRILAGLAHEVAHLRPGHEADLKPPKGRRNYHGPEWRACFLRLMVDRWGIAARPQDLTPLRRAWDVDQFLEARLVDSLDP